MSATDCNVSVPSIDLSPFLVDEGVVVGDPPTPAQLKVASQIDASCRGNAFLHVTNFGVSPALRNAALEASQQLFASREKENLRRIDPSTNTGYSPFLSENINRTRPTPERKEAFNVRWQGNDFTGCPKEFEKVAQEMQVALKKSARRYGLACALALGLPTRFFANSLDQMNLCTLRFLHYPAFDQYNPKEDPPCRIGEHTDFGAYTFLLLGSNGAEGLQIKPVLGGETQEKGHEGWSTVEVPAVPDNTVGALVNTGALMARWTNDEWRATAHRVLILNQLQASRSRYSIAFFVDPDRDHLVTVHDKFTHGWSVEKKYSPVKSQDYLKIKLQEMMGKK